MENYIYGKNPIFSLIQKKTSWIKEIFIQKGISLNDREKEIIEIFKGKISIIEFKNHFDEKTLLENHQGFIALTKEFNYTPFPELLKNTSQAQTILILDQIHDPHNFGAIIRSAAMFGVDGIIILDHRQIVVNPTVIKVSSGTIFSVPICKVSNLSNAIKVLQENGFWSYGTAMRNDSQNINKVNFADKTIIIVGNEGSGVSSKLLDQSDFLIKIPTGDIIDSLNVSVATGVILYERSKLCRT